MGCLLWAGGVAQAQEPTPAARIAVPAEAPPSAPSSTTVQPPVNSSAPGAVRAQTADEAFNTRVKTLEEQVSDLKEKIFRTKARLLLLQETVLGGDLSTGSRAVLFHKNEMGSSFVLESVSYSLDGAPIFTKVDNNGDLDKREELEIFNGRIVPGQHQISVRMKYRGHGYGIFSYLEGYKFNVTNAYTFNADPGKSITIKIIGFEKGGITADLKDRPSIRFEPQVTKDVGPKPQGGQAAKPAPSEGAK